MNILVTGANGFIGKNIVNHQLFKAFHVIHAPISSKEFFTRSVIDYVKENKIDVIIHAALAPCTNNESIIENVRMFDKIMACAPYVKRIVTFSSGIMYSKGYAQETSSRDNHYEGKNYYYHTLKEIEDKYYIRTNNRFPGKLISFIPYYVYGIGEEPTRLISSIYNQLLRGDASICQDRYMSFMYIDDLVKSINEVIQWDDHEITFAPSFIPPTSTETVLSVALEIRDLMESHNSVILADTTDYASYSTHKSTNVPNVITTPLTEGITHMINHFKEIK